MDQERAQNAVPKTLPRTGPKSPISGQTLWNNDLRLFLGFKSYEFFQKHGPSPEFVKQITKPESYGPWIWDLGPFRAPSIRSWILQPEFEALRFSKFVYSLTQTAKWPKLPQSRKLLPKRLKAPHSRKSSVYIWIQRTLNPEKSQTWTTSQPNSMNSIQLP